MVAVCSVVGVVMSQSSVAADTTRTANVAIDWSQLQISVTGVDGIIPGVTFSNQYTSLYSSASVPGEQSENNSKSVYNWTSDQGTNADAGTTFANTYCFLVNPISNRASREYGLAILEHARRVLFGQSNRKLFF